MSLTEIIVIVAIGLIAATTGTLAQIFRRRVSQWQLATEIRERHARRIRSLDNEADREQAMNVAAASNRVLTGPLTDRELSDGERREPSKLLTLADLQIVADDLKILLRAEGRRSSLSGFVQNFIFTALGIIAGIIPQKYPLL